MCCSQSFTRTIYVLQPVLHKDHLQQHLLKDHRTKTYPSEYTLEGVSYIIEEVPRGRVYNAVLQQELLPTKVYSLTSNQCGVGGGTPNTSP
jgi:hypothetical protein